MLILFKPGQLAPAFLHAIFYYSHKIYGIISKKKESRMPIICKFFGITIFMYWKEHAPPHFHAKYGDEEIVIEIKTGVMAGSMTNRAAKMIQEWRELHKNELLKDWKLAEQKKALFSIKPLE